MPQADEKGNIERDEDGKIAGTPTSEKKEEEKDNSGKEIIGNNSNTATGAKKDSSTKKKINKILGSNFKNNSALVEHQWFPPEYFSSADVSIYMGDVFLSEVSMLSFTLEEKLFPIYSYASYTYDEMARGNRIVSGQLAIPFTEAGYLDSILSHIGQFTKENERVKPKLAYKKAGEEWNTLLSEYKMDIEGYYSRAKVKGWECNDPLKELRNEMPLKTLVNGNPNNSTFTNNGTPLNTTKFNARGNVNGSSGNEYRLYPKDNYRIKKWSPYGEELDNKDMNSSGWNSLRSEMESETGMSWEDIKNLYNSAKISEKKNSDGSYTTDISFEEEIEFSGADDMDVWWTEDGYVYNPQPGEANTARRKESSSNDWSWATKPPPPPEPEPEPPRNPLLDDDGYIKGNDGKKYRYVKENGEIYLYVKRAEGVQPERYSSTSNGFQGAFKTMKLAIPDKTPEEIMSICSSMNVRVESDLNEVPSHDGNGFVWANGGNFQAYKIDSNDTIYRGIINEGVVVPKDKFEKNDPKYQEVLNEAIKYTGQSKEKIKSASETTKSHKRYSLLDDRLVETDDHQKYMQNGGSDVDPASIKRKSKDSTTNSQEEAALPTVDSWNGYPLGFSGGAGVFGNPPETINNYNMYTSHYEKEIWGRESSEDKDHRYQTFFYTDRVRKNASLATDTEDRQQILKKKGFDIYIVYGPAPDAEKYHTFEMDDTNCDSLEVYTFQTTVKAIRGVQLQSTGQTIHADDGSGLLEVYSFLALDCD